MRGASEERKSFVCIKRKRKKRRFSASSRADRTGRGKERRDERLTRDS